MPRRPAGAPTLHLERLVQAPGVALHDWRCAGHDTPRGGGEESASFNLVVVRRGAFAVERAGRRLLLVAGQAWLSRAGEPRRFTHPVPGGDDCTVFTLGDDALRALLDRPGDDRRALAAAVARDAAFLDGEGALLHARAYRAARDDRDALAAEEGATRLLAHVAPAFVPAAARLPREGAGARRAAAQALEYVATHYHGPVTVAAVAAAVGVSPFHLSRLVTRATGRSLHQHVVRLRLRDALERVLDTRDGLTTIALELGWSSHSHFTAAFRREYGVTPARLRGGRAGACRASG